jgi:hypothetical protein
MAKYPRFSDCQGISSILESYLTKFIQIASPRTLTSLIITYLKSRPSEQQAIWFAILQALAQLIHDEDNARKTASKQLLSLLAQSERLPNVLDASDAFANSVLILLDNILQEDKNADSDAKLLHFLLSRPGMPLLNHLFDCFSHLYDTGVFINQAAFDAIYATINSHLTQMTLSLLQKDSLDPTLPLALLLVQPMLSTAKDPEHCSFLSSVFLIAHAKWEDPSALRIWNSWRKAASPNARERVKGDITNILRTAMSDVDSQMRCV